MSCQQHYYEMTSRDVATCRDCGTETYTSYICANCRQPSGMIGHYSGATSSFTCEKYPLKVEPGISMCCPNCGDGMRTATHLECESCQWVPGDKITRGFTKLWHDDIRRPPDDSWYWARTNQDAVKILLTNDIVEISMDHDLGLHDYDPDVQDADLQAGWDKENDGKQLVIAMVALNIVPEKITVHSWNPPGAEMMASWLRQHGHDVLVKPYERKES